MDYIYLIAAVLVSINAFSYGLWIKKNGNLPGAIFVFCLVMVCIGLPIFKIMKGP